ncbi:MAG: TetR/AcrR family transcriptional regulator [Bacteroidales bacterium]|nr:TetR/AcrR family transcriptional regulator [Bacteroidales bacterium]
MENTKNEILKVSLKFFFQNGIRKTSNSQLVAILGISTKTLYKHFKNKEDLLGQALELFYLKQYESVKKLTKKQSAVIILYNLWRLGFDREFRVNNVFYHDLNYYYSELEKKIEAKNSRRFGKKFIQVVYRGIEECDIRKEIHPRALLEALTVLYVSVVRKGEFNRIKISNKELFLSTLLPFIRGICTDKGMQILDAYLTESVSSDILDILV